jgi:hypothetical protein
LRLAQSIQLTNMRTQSNKCKQTTKKNQKKPCQQLKNLLFFSRHEWTNYLRSRRNDQKNC